jgi:AraC family transcriptional regulator, regulatory protein of adaptative response / methylated-DNA-[protein]-cysteine methyltransferase
MLSFMQNDPVSTRIDQALRRAAELDFIVQVSQLADWAGLSTGHFQRLFRARFGATPGQVLRHARIQRFGQLLRGGMSVTDAAVEAGFGSSSRSHQAARDGLGMTPSRLRAGGRKEHIVYGLADCRLGRVLVAATEKGLCAVLMGEDDEVLLAELKMRFPKASLGGADESFMTVQRSVIRLIDGGSSETPDLPLDLRGTVFQLKVWTVLQGIPAGETITYGELARRIGLPGGARAVAGACGANPAAVIVPCHRVVAANGGLGGYRWGVERKRALLDHESLAG